MKNLNWRGKVGEAKFQGGPGAVSTGKSPTPNYGKSTVRGKTKSDGNNEVNLSSYANRRVSHGKK